MSPCIRQAIEQALDPGRFFVAGGSLAWNHQASECTRWEIFRGHLLDHRQTRAEAIFESWSVLFELADGSTQPQVVSLKLAGSAGPLYVTRQLPVYGAETYDSAPNTIATRTAQISQRELVGTIDCRAFASNEALAAEIAHYVLLALVGTSRLPILSVESPLPAFSLGHIGYSPDNRPAAAPIVDPIQWIERSLWPGAAPQQARVLELALRATSSAAVPAVARAWQRRSSEIALQPADTLRTAKALFNQIALTPYTSAVDNLVGFLGQLATLSAISTEQLVDLLGFMLRQLVRHLNAFDLVLFHNRGANYPDALLLESLLEVYIPLVEHHADWFLAHVSDSAERARMKRIRRRALRGAVAIRLQYAGHLVPDVPTSPGENARVLAGDRHRAPGEQLLESAARRKRLFAGEPQALPPTAAQVLAQSLADLEDPREMTELGTALFLDRPLGLFHDAGHVDRTPLVSYEALSRTVAAARVERLREALEIGPARRAQLNALAEQMCVGGMPIGQLPARETAGVVALEDALRAAPDFVVRRSMRQSLNELLAGYDLSALAEADATAYAWLTASPDVVLVRTLPRAAAQEGGEFLTAFDSALRGRLQIALAQPGRPDYFERTGSERLRIGLRVKHVDGAPCDLPVPACC